MSQISDFQPLGQNGPTNTFLDKTAFFVLRFDAKSAEATLFKSENVMQHRSPGRAWFHNVKDLHEWVCQTVEPSTTVAAPIAMNAKQTEKF